jgi:hypothetical protein
MWEEKNPFRILGVKPQEEQSLHLSLQRSGPTDHLSPFLPVAVFLQAKRLEREPNNPRPSSADT